MRAIRCGHCPCRIFWIAWLPSYLVTCYFPMPMTRAQSEFWQELPLVHNAIAEHARNCVLGNTLTFHVG